MKNKADNAFELIRKKSLPSWFIMAIVLLALWILFAIISPHFFSVRNLSNLLKHSSILGIATAGMLVMILMGCFDLSIGSNAACSGMLAALAISYTQSPVLGLIVGIVTGIAISALNGFMVTKLGINALITSLGSMLLFRGVTHLPNAYMGISILNKPFKFLAHGSIGPIPLIVIITIIVYAVIYFLLKYTKYGRDVYAVGGNPMASFHSGINIKRVTFIGFLIGGFTAGLAGSLTTSMTSGASPLANPHLALEAISAVILGGASVHGGKGRISGTILGFLILGSISNGLSLANVASYHQMIFKGIMLVVAVAFDVIRENKRRSLVLYS
jgi:ribose transport system permease protein